MLFRPANFAMKSLSTDLQMAAYGLPNIGILPGHPVVSKQWRKLFNIAAFQRIDLQKQNLVLHKSGRGLCWHARVPMLALPSLANYDTPQG